MLFRSALVVSNLATAALSLCLTGCGDDSNEKPDAEVPEPFAFDAVTFNMALTTTVKGPAERMPGILSALEAESADVLCLQEAFVGVTTPAEIAERLAGTYPHAYVSPVPVEAPFGPGLVLVSKHPLAGTAALRFTNEDSIGIVDRSVISADVSRDGRTFRVACTHLSAGLDEAGVALRGLQVDEIFSFLGGMPEVDGPTLLLGDFNAGPDPVGACTPTTDPACEPADTTTYDRILEEFEDPNAELAECTQCKTQFDSLQVISLFSSEPDQRIDHCFAKDLDPYTHLGTEIVLDEAVAIPFGDETLGHLSDHRGLRCSLGRP